MARPIPGGFLVAMEGIDGAGKTTQAEMLAELCRKNGLACLISKEPTNGTYGSILRQSAQNGRLSLEAELDLFLKDRREHVETVINPALARGEIVILDRYYFSTAAYQGARGADPQLIIEINESFAPRPDLLVILDVSPSLGLVRIRHRGDEPNKFETLESLQKAREIFNSMRPPHRMWIDATTGPEIIHFHLANAFQIAALNKIGSRDFSSSGINRVRELFGRSPIPLADEASFA